uniref:Flagellin n=1 Tax=uncultured spirochete TaxID=156406 RepID=A0A224AU75_9SPIR|nr:flagellin [uncultured spirochete]
MQGLKVVNKNIQLGINFLATSETWLNSIDVILQELRNLAVRTASGIYTKEDRDQIKQQVLNYTNEIERISSVAQYNKLNLFQGNLNSSNINSNLNTKKNLATDKKIQPTNTSNSSTSNSNTLNLHIGPNVNENIQINLEKISLLDLGLKESNDIKSKLTISFETDKDSNESIEKLDNAIKKINTLRSNLGSQARRIEMALESALENIQNFETANSIIQDTNIAEEITKYIQNKLLADTSSIMLSQSNLHPNIALKLLDIH